SRRHLPRLHYASLAITIVAANLGSTRLPCCTHVPGPRIQRFGVEDDGDHAAPMRRADHQNRAHHSWTWIPNHDPVTVVYLPNLLRRDRVSRELVDRVLREEQD